MERKIEFRGKRLGSGEWLYGDLMHDNHHGCYVYPNDCDGLYTENKVDPDTVGQFSGLLDKHGNKIYEGDIVKHVGGMRRNEQGEWVDNPEFMTVEYIDARFNVDFYSKCTFSIEVIGNIHDNPELLL